MDIRLSAVRSSENINHYLSVFVVSHEREKTVFFLYSPSGSFDVSYHAPTGYGYCNDYL